MRAIGTHTLGDLRSLSEVDVPAPTAGEGQVRVRVHAAAVNPADVKIVRWGGPARFLHARVSPLVPGYDLSGVVDEVGPGVTGLAIGDAVFGHLAYSGKNRQGTFAEQVVVDAGTVAKKPDAIPHVDAAASATTGLTALQALREAAVGEGSRVLVLGASGGVGAHAVGIAKRLGAHVTGVCSTYAVGFVEGLGADAVVDRKARDPLSLDGTFDAVFDTTGLYAYGSCAHLLTAEGAFVTTLPSFSFVLGKLRTLFGSRRCLLVVVESRRADLEQLARWIADGMTVPIAETFPVRDAASALEGVDSGGLLGKVAIEVDGGF